MESFIKNLSVKSKMQLIFGVVFFFTALFVLVNIPFIVNIRDISGNKEAVLRTVRQVLALKAGVDDGRRAILSLVLDRGYRSEKHVKDLHDASETVYGQLLLLETGDFQRTEEFSLALARFKGAWEDFVATRNAEILPAIEAGNYKRAESIAMGAQEERYILLAGLSERLSDESERKAASLGMELDRAVRNTLIAAATTIFLGLATASLLITFISKDILRRFGLLMGGINRFRAGDLDVKFKCDSKDELGILAESLNAMVRRIYEDRIVQDQYIEIVNWEAREREERAVELERVNATLSGMQENLKQKNAELECYVGELGDANRLLEATRLQVIESEKLASIGLLSAGVAHEINNPLAFISTNLNFIAEHVEELRKVYGMYDLALDHAANGRQEEAVGVFNEIDDSRRADMEYAFKDANEAIKESREGVARIVSIVKALKNFSRSGGEEATECDLNACIDETLRLAWNDIKHRVKVEKDLGVIPPIVGKPRELGQVFLNIIMNAVQSMWDNGILSIKTRLEAGFVVTEIIDTGCGIPEENLKKIFDPFFTTKPVGQGTGLGLSIAYGIVAEHAGEIRADSTVGIGTKFTIKIPVKTLTAGQ